MTDRSPSSSTAGRHSSKRATLSAASLGRRLRRCSPRRHPAQQRPLSPRIPRPWAPGRVLIEARLRLRAQRRVSGLGPEGNLLRVPLVGVSVGISSIAELQIDGGFYNRLSITQPRPGARWPAWSTATGDSTCERRGPGGRDQDPHAVGAAWPAVVRHPLRHQAAERLERERPRPRHHRFLRRRSWRPRPCGRCGWSATSALGILGDPTRGDRQNDVADLRRVVRARADQRREIVGEVNGRLDTRAGEAAARHREPRGLAPVRRALYHRRLARRCGVFFGLTARDPSFGFAAGFTYVFNAFTVP